MEDEYNWQLISWVSVPIGIAVAIVFYIPSSDFWRWVSLFSGLVLAFAIVYGKTKKKQNLFTAVAIVFLIALFVRLLQLLGII